MICPNPDCKYEQAGKIAQFMTPPPTALGWCPKCGTLFKAIMNKEGQWFIPAYTKPNPAQKAIIVPPAGVKIIKGDGGKT